MCLQKTTPRVAPHTCHALRARPENPIFPPGAAAWRGAMIRFFGGIDKTMVAIGAAVFGSKLGVVRTSRRRPRTAFLPLAMTTSCMTHLIGLGPFCPGYAEHQTNLKHV